MRWGGGGRGERKREKVVAIARKSEGAKRALTKASVNL